MGYFYDKKIFSLIKTEILSFNLQNARVINNTLYKKVNNLIIDETLYSFNSSVNNNTITFTQASVSNNTIII